MLGNKIDVEDSKRVVSRSHSVRTLQSLINIRSPQKEQ